MESDEFWALVDESREGSGGDLERQTELLTTALARRTPDDIVSFDALFHTTRAQGYSWDLWAVGYLAAGGMSDDAFLDFRALLIGRGQQVWEQAVDDPDSLADALDDDPGQAIGDAEGLAYAAMAAYERSTGSPMPSPADGPDDNSPDDDGPDDGGTGPAPGAAAQPSGLPWDEDDPKDLATRFPKSWATWGQGDQGDGDDGDGDGDDRPGSPTPA